MRLDGLYLSHNGEIHLSLMSTGQGTQKIWMPLISSKSSAGSQPTVSGIYWPSRTRFPSHSNNLQLWTKSECNLSAANIGFFFLHPVQCPLISCTFWLCWLFSDLSKKLWWVQHHGHRHDSQNYKQKKTLNIVINGSYHPIEDICKWIFLWFIFLFKMRTGQTFQENSSQNEQQQGRMSLRYQYEACQLHILRNQCTSTMCCDIHIKQPSKRKQDKKWTKSTCMYPKTLMHIRAGWSSRSG